MGTGSSIDGVDDVSAVEEGKGREMNPFLSGHDEVSSGTEYENEKKPVTKKLVIDVHGMTCSNCSGTVEKCLNDIKGVQHAAVSLMMERAEVIYRPDEVKEDFIVEEVEDCGFDAKIRPQHSPLDHSVNIMRIVAPVSSAAADTLRSLIESPGILSVDIPSRSDDKEGYPSNMLYIPTPAATTTAPPAKIPRILQKVIVKFDPDCVGVREVAMMVADSLGSFGYEGVWLETGDTLEAQQAETAANKKRELELWRFYFYMSLLFSLPVFFVAVVCGNIEKLGKPLDQKVFSQFSLTWKALVLFILATPVQLGPGYKFCTAAVKSIRHGAASMDVLIALGSGVAYLYSIFSIFMSFACGTNWNCKVFFDTSAMLISVVLLGRLMEHLTKGKTSEALTRLMQLQPKMATLVKASREVSVTVQTLAMSKGAQSKNGMVEGKEGLDDDDDDDDPLDAKRASAAEESLAKLSEFGMEEISVHLVQKGDILLVKRGATVPVDGILVKGETAVNQGMLTGEALPVYKQPWDRMIGGTTNVEKNVYMQADCENGRDSVLSQIVRLVQDAQGNKPPIQATADAVAAMFVPAVVLASFVTFVIWLAVLASGIAPSLSNEEPFLFALMRGVSVLVISCPCSLGLATPTAIMVATGVAASAGILYKTGAALEMAGRCTTVVFDKTGTLTEANASVVAHAIISLPKDLDEIKVWRMVASLESLSEHMLGSAIASFAMKEGQLTGSPTADTKRSDAQAEVKNYEARTGAGVRGVIEGSKVAIGNARWMKANGVEVTSKAEAVAASYNSKGHIACYIAVDDMIVGMVGISDTPKTDAPTLVQWLKEQNIKTYMITGDTANAAEYCASEVGIEQKNVYADALPQEKIRLIKQLQDSGEKVLFLGDGINDAPALAQADVGVSVSQGTDIAMETADVVMVRNDSLLDLATVIDLSRETLKRIKMNFGWALVYNVIGIPVAAGILFPAFHLLLPPELAALAMGCSSTSVVLSSLWLKRYSKPFRNDKNSSWGTHQGDGRYEEVDNASEISYDCDPAFEDDIGRLVSLRNMEAERSDKDRQMKIITGDDHYGDLEG
eukprot:CAMPEP_0167790736 /NCGR_PEP_ID=MMETSP0111_2-20121227/11512_1 /TAXON_ID=91324 /ORGANISM="Lotharella globosa, Strain CCCM811" /LENGTH=1074 /DNA_ID=CAMNT_0007683259 /DNA_START=15 /DNA_END=3239 /DNA_ORIENTATION=+